jgi:hypothetical protein
MAAGAIPPPLFFEPRRSRKRFDFRPWQPQERLSLRTPWKTHQLENTASVDHAI